MVDDQKSSHGHGTGSGNDINPHIRSLAFGALLSSSRAFVRLEEFISALPITPIYYWDERYYADFGRAQRSLFL